MRAATAGEGRALVSVFPQTSSLTAAAVAVASHLDVPPQRILQPVSHAERRRRHIALYLAHVVRGVAIKKLAREAGLSPRQTRRVIGEIEDRRDDPAVDATVSRLEEAVACAS